MYPNIDSNISYVHHCGHSGLDWIFGALLFKAGESEPNLPRRSLSQSWNEVLTSRRALTLKAVVAHKIARIVNQDRPVTLISLGSLGGRKHERALYRTDALRRNDATSVDGVKRDRQPERTRDLHNGGEAGVTVGGQRLVEAFATHPGAASQLAEVA